MDQSKENIFLFVPNLIGYARIVLALISFYYMPTDYATATFCYLLSGLLDAFDGYAARWLNQSTKFGALLDQLTDRCATMCLLVNLSFLYPKYMFLFQMSMIIDIASHWIYVQTSLMRGKSHKYIDPSDHPVMKIYYTNRTVLFCMCAGNELFYGMLYLAYFTQGPIIPILGVGVFKMLCILCTPVALVKTMISLLHLAVACMNLSIIDVNERKEIENAKKKAH